MFPGMQKFQQMTYVGSEESEGHGLLKGPHYFKKGPIMWVNMAVVTFMKEEHPGIFRIHSPGPLDGVWVSEAPSEKEEPGECDPETEPTKGAIQVEFAETKKGEGMELTFRAKVCLALGIDHDTHSDKEILAEIEASRKVVAVAVSLSGLGGH